MFCLYVVWHTNKVFRTQFPECSGVGLSTKMKVVINGLYQTEHMMTVETITITPAFYLFIFRIIKGCCLSFRIHKPAVVPAKQ